MLRIDRFDHIVLTVASIDQSVAFYRKLGLHIITFGENRIAATFGSSAAPQRIHFHEIGRVVQPRARRATAGSADLCFVLNQPVNEIAQHLADSAIPIELGPVPRHGAAGNMQSFYLRDPDGNLIELATYLP